MPSHPLVQPIFIALRLAVGADLKNPMTFRVPGAHPERLPGLPLLRLAKDHSCPAERAPGFRLGLDHTRHARNFQAFELTPFMD
jgi:hypothetical protein